MDQTYTQQPALHIEIPRGAEPSTETTDGFLRMREWQTRCFDQLSSSQDWIINAPMAAGKSFEICAIAAGRLNRDEHLRVIIAVPQTIIGAGFESNKIEYPDGTRVVWEIGPSHDLCRETRTKSTTHLLNFLKCPTSQDPMSRVILCSHATLVRAFAKNKAAFSQVLLVIDEAHHVKHGGTADVDLEIENQLGALVKHALENPDRMQLGLSTATLFRGDTAQIVPDLTRFARFELPYDEYLATCKYLRGFSFDFVTHSASFVDPLAHIFAQKVAKTLVYIPPVGTASSLGSKAKDVEAVLKAIAGTEHVVLADEDQPIMRVKRGDDWIKVVNLVDERLRERKKEAIIAAHKKPNADDIDVIIALGMFKEGANWRWADCEVIIGRRGSLTEIIQMIGRLFRDAVGKNHVEVYQLLPFALDQVDKTVARENLNGYLTAILLSMLLENVVDPVPVSPSSGDGQGGKGKPRINYLRAALGNDGEAIVVLDEIKQQVLDAAAPDSSALSADELQQTFRDIVSNVLFAHGVREYHDEATQQIVRMFSRRTVALQGLNVGNLGIDLVKANPFGCLLQYASDACGVRTFQELRSASRARAFKPFADARAFVNALKLSSVLEWYDYCASGEKPDDIPSNPYIAYNDSGWTGYGDWLGTGRTVPAYRPFPEAREFVHGLRLKGQRQWKEYCASGEKPNDIPSKPDYTYRDDGWKDLGDWLGTGTVATFRRKYRPFAEARAYIHNLHFKSLADWQRYRRSAEKPSDIPTNPNVVYEEDGWRDLGDWLGTGRVGNRNRSYRPFLEARQFVRALQLRTQKDWVEYCKSGRRPVDIPQKPDRTYIDEGWDGFGDWLGTGNRSNRDRVFRPFQEARQFVHDLELHTQRDWIEYCKAGEKPVDIPWNPAEVYKDDGWNGLADWLGTEPRFRPFLEAQEFVRSLGLQSQTDWRDYCDSGEQVA